MSNSVVAPSPADNGGPPPLPQPHRRPRVREVSSRFMSPAPSPISSAGDLHSITMKSPKHSISTPAPDRSSKPSPSQRRLLLRSHAPEPFSSTSHENIPETARSMDTPFQCAKPELLSTQRRQRAVKLFKENGFEDQIQISKSSTIRTNKPSRPDTPSDRIVPSRFRLPQQRQSNSSVTVTDAAKLLQSGLSFSSSSNNDLATSISQTLHETESESIQGGSCPNSPISSRHTKLWPVPDTNTSSSCSSTVGGSNSQPSSSSSSSLSTPSLCTRSLNLTISGCHNSFKSIERTLSKAGPASSLSTEYRLPPQPNCAKLGVDLKKGKKPQSSQQDIHSLKLLHNHYMMWRYANAKAHASMHAQRTEMEKQFFSLGTDISHLRDTVKKKQAELAILQQTKALSTILETQMPYLDEWSALEEDYTRSLSGAITALTNSLLRLPLSGNVQVNVRDAAEALDSAVKTADMIVHQMQIFLPKAEEMESLISELATVIDVERALVEECGNLLVKTHTLQVEDCSLRGHLMQVDSS